MLTCANCGEEIIKDSIPSSGYRHVKLIRPANWFHGCAYYNPNIPTYDKNHRYIVANIKKQPWDYLDSTKPQEEFKNNLTEIPKPVLVSTIEIDIIPKGRKFKNFS